jgi:hypothetical protein
MKTPEQQNAGIVYAWQRYGIESIYCKFYCGGDSMSDIEYSVNLASGEEPGIDIWTYIDEDYLENLVYKHIEFYVNSDGHFLGESGTVVIRLVKADDNYVLDFVKHSESEYESAFSADTEDIFNLDHDAYAMARFAAENVDRAQVGGWDRVYNCEFRHDCMMPEGFHEWLEKDMECQPSRIETDQWNGPVSAECVSEWMHDPVLVVIDNFEIMKNGAVRISYTCEDWGQYSAEERDIEGTYDTGIPITTSFEDIEIMAELLLKEN